MQISLQLQHSDATVFAAEVQHKSKGESKNSVVSNAQELFVLIFCLQDSFLYRQPRPQLVSNGCGCSCVQGVFEKQARSSCKSVVISGWYKRKNFPCTGIYPLNLAGFFLQGFLCFCGRFNLESLFTSSCSSLIQLHLCLSAVISCFSNFWCEIFCFIGSILSGASFQKVPLYCHTDFPLHLKT